MIFLKESIAESVQMIREQLQETSEEVRSRAEEAIAIWIKEKELKDAEIATAMQQILNGVLAVSIFELGLGATIIFFFLSVMIAEYGDPGWSYSLGCFTVFLLFIPVFLLDKLRLAICNLICRCSTLSQLTFITSKRSKK